MFDLPQVDGITRLLVVSSAILADRPALNEAEGNVPAAQAKRKDSRALSSNRWCYDASEIANPQAGGSE